MERLSAREAEVIVLASINIDTNLKVERFPQPGETVTASSSSSRLGGKGLNQAIAAARLGVPTRVIGHVGEDPQGREAVQRLRMEERLDSSTIRTAANCATGTATVLLDDNGENCIVISPGANSLNSQETVETDLLRSGLEKVLICQLEVPQAAVASAIRLAKDNGVFTILNAAPYVEDVGFYDQVDLLVVNETEAAALIGMRLRTSLEYAEAVREILGVDTIVTLGAVGAVWADDNGGGFCPGHEIQVVDTTGAGDAFVGGLGASLAQSATLAESVRVGNRLGGIAAQFSGAQGYKVAEEVKLRATSCTVIETTSYS